MALHLNMWDPQPSNDCEELGEPGALLGVRRQGEEPDSPLLVNFLPDVLGPFDGADLTITNQEQHGPLNAG